MASTQMIPMFPLELLLLPGEQTELHLFEPRYRELYKDLIMGDSSFVIPYLHEQKLGSIGCKVNLIDTVKSYEDGRADILIECECIVELEDFVAQWNDKMYPGGKYEERYDYQKWRASDILLSEFSALKNVLGERAQYLQNLEYKYVLNILSFLNVSSWEKYRFLIDENPDRQQKKLTQMVRFARLILGQEKTPEHGFFMN